MSEVTTQKLEQNVLQPVIFYIDADFRCYAEPGKDRREMQSTFFAGREADISRYRYVPQGESWMREDGAVFAGEMITPMRT